MYVRYKTYDVTNYVPYTTTSWRGGQWIKFFPLVGYPRLGFPWISQVNRLAADLLGVFLELILGSLFSLGLKRVRPTSVAGELHVVCFL